MKTNLVARLTAGLAINRNKINQINENNKTTNGGKLKMINISKKILAIMVLAVFVLSIVPLAWAEDAQTGAESQAGDLSLPKLEEPSQGQAQPNPGQFNQVPQPNNPGQANNQGVQPFNQEPKQFNQAENQMGNKPLLNPKDNPMKVGAKFKEGKESQGVEGEFEGEFKEPQEGEYINSEVEDKENQAKKEDQGFKLKLPQFINDFFNKWKKQPFEPEAAEPQPQGQFGQPGAMPPGQPEDKSKECWVEGEQVPCASENQAPLEVEPKKCWVDEKEVLCASKAKVTPELIERHRVFNQKFIKAREKHQEAKEQLVENRRELAQLKEKVSACDKEAGTCPEAKEQMLVGIQNHLIKTGEVIKDSLEKLVNRVEDSNVLTDAEKEDAKAKISALDEKIKAKMEEIEALADGEINAAELRLKIKELKDLWQEVSKAQRWTVTQMINSKMENVVDKHQEYVNGMEMRIADLEKKGAAPERIEALKAKVEEFKEEVAVLKDDYTAAEQAWAEAKGDVTKGAFTEAKNKQQEVREQLKVTKGMLREFIVMYKDVYKATVKTAGKQLPPVAEGTSPISEGTPASEEAAESAAEESSEAGEETAEEAGEESAEQASENASELT